MRISVPPGHIAFIINNRDRLGCLKEQLNWVLNINEHPVKVVIIDNDSTYQPLLNYYREIEIAHENLQVVRLARNGGSRVIAQVKIVGGMDQYIYTDSDIIPKEDCPADLIAHLIKLSNKYPRVHKIGVALEIGDIPDHFPLRHEVIRHESSFWQKQTSSKDAYHAGVDTTFAVYRKKTSSVHIVGENIRSMKPYVARHEPWYMDPKNLPEDFLHYCGRCSDEASWIKQLEAKGLISNVLIPKTTSRDRVKRPAKEPIKSAKIYPEIPPKQPRNAFIEQLVGRSYTYKSATHNMNITFVSETMCTGWNDTVSGDLVSKKGRVRIGWKDPRKGVSILDFDFENDKFTGISTLDGNIIGRFSHFTNHKARERIETKSRTHTFIPVVDYLPSDNSKQSIILYMNYYVDPVPVRDKEIKDCFFKNVTNDSIEKIVCFKDFDTDIPTNDAKVQYVNHIGRPKYEDFFRAMKHFSHPNNVSILANTDIYFDKSLRALLDHKFKPNQCFAISRWEKSAEQLSLQTGSDSQDVWIFKGWPRDTVYGDFCLGKAGCDNRIAHELEKAGYILSNPVHTIKCIHLHQSQLRRYSRAKNDMISGPYARVVQTQLKKR